MILMQLIYYLIKLHVFIKNYYFMVDQKNFLAMRIISKNLQNQQCISISKVITIDINCCCCCCFPIYKKNTKWFIKCIIKCIINYFRQIILIFKNTVKYLIIPYSHFLILA